MNVVVGRARTREFASSSETLRPVRRSKRKERKKNNIPGVDLVITAHTFGKKMCYIHKGKVNNALSVAAELLENPSDAQVKFISISYHAISVFRTELDSIQ